MTAQILPFTALEEIRPRCPECGVGTIGLVLDGEVGVPYANLDRAADHGIEYRMQRRPFGACNTCEFCIEIGG